MTSGSLSNVKLTSERYPNLKRGQFATLNDDDITAFKTILDEGKFAKKKQFMNHG